MKSTSIRFIIIYMIIIFGVLTTAVLGFFVYNNSKSSIESQFNNEADLILTHTAKDFNEKFIRAERVIGYLAEFLLKDAENEFEIETKLEALQYAMPSSWNMFYASPEGTMFAGREIDFPSSYRPSEQEWYEEAQANPNQLIWTEPYLDYFTQQIVITASQSIVDENGQLFGVVAIDYAMADLSSTISDYTIGDEGFVMLLSRDGTILGNKGDYMIGRTLLGDDFGANISNLQGGWVTREFDGHRYDLRATETLQNGMYIVTATNQGEIVKKVFQANLLVFVVGLLVLLIFSYMLYSMAQRGIKPLAKLVQLMGSAEAGNYDVRAEVRNYYEVTRLTNGFNSMLEAIQKRDDDIIKSHNELKATEEELRKKYCELKTSRAEIERLASFDSLTGLLNRRSFKEKLNTHLLHHQNGTYSAVFFVDLDNFKIVNDTMGHSMGDHLIQQVSERLSSIQFDKKLIARIGGDEFILFVEGLSSLENVQSAAKDLLNVLKQPVYLDSIPFIVTASVGVAVSPLHGDSSEQLMKYADMAMYRAKSIGKNQFSVYDEKLAKEIERKIWIERGIQHCLENQEFHLFFQPIYSMNQERVTNVEALLRCSSDYLKEIPIFEIIQVAEETGQIISIDNWVLREASKRAKEMNERRSTREIIKVSVNISAMHIAHADFIGHVLTILREVDVDPSLIELEITETAVMERFDVNKDKLKELRALGISIHLDDFGTGYSSLNYLKDLSIDYVKLDKSFIDHMAYSEKDAGIVKAILRLAHHAGLKVIVEGVETKEQYELLQLFRCDYVQGYYISKPRRLNELTECTESKLMLV
ncbi:bifunctional diguanylate cyclase/phosphodiesterase [Bacillus sp. FJAT-45037]|uniref:bifunctional diguanylate cyclase/phosphodiesterase n=1 Tax=Bacillus sp. FJAT-45037 TaxID=2011007 RepID=UPI0018E20C9D|nr:EAL domain-containing protein [Bacillus sp. FJAT-45037]